jgi:hypothetical protein
MVELKWWGLAISGVEPGCWRHLLSLLSYRLPRVSGLWLHFANLGIYNEGDQLDGWHVGSYGFLSLRHQNNECVVNNFASRWA